MSDKKFIRILIIVAVIGLILTAAHAVYMVHAYERSSIIQLIARELW